MSSHLMHLPEASFNKGGLFQVLSPKGGSTQYALTHISTLLNPVDPSSPSLEEALPCIWISNDLMLYPPVLFCRFPIPLTQWLLVKAENPTEAWRVGLEAVNTGLFGWIFLRPTQACHPSHLRRLQIAAERTRAKVFLLGNVKIPHWTLTLSIEVDKVTNDEADSLHSELVVRRQTGRGMSFAYAQG